MKKRNAEIQGLRKGWDFTTAGRMAGKAYKHVRNSEECVKKTGQAFNKFCDKMISVLERALKNPAWTRERQRPINPLLLKKVKRIETAYVAASVDNEILSQVREAWENLFRKAEKEPSCLSHPMAEAAETLPKRAKKAYITRLSPSHSRDGADYRKAWRKGRVIALRSIKHLNETRLHLEIVA